MWAGLGIGWLAGLGTAGLVALARRAGRWLRARTARRALREELDLLEWELEVRAGGGGFAGGGGPARG